MNRGPIAFFNLQRAHAELKRDLEDCASRVIFSGNLILGESVARFERDFAAFCEVEHAVGVGNGLDAITLILRALDIGPGHEVIVPGHTFIATWLAVSACGATIVPVDIDRESFNIAPDRVARAITARTRAIVAVHLYGRPAPMRELAAIAESAGVALVEDAAQAHGARHNGRAVGSLGVAAAFSFYPTKNLGALGDAGAVTTNDQNLAQRVRLLRNYGSRVKYHHEVSGVNSRLDELQAAFLSVKLSHLDAKNARRREIAARYSEALEGLPGLTVPWGRPEDDCVWHLYVVRSGNRDNLQDILNKDGIGTMIHYPVPPQRQAAFAAESAVAADLAESDLAAREVLSLPLWPEMTDDEVDRVISAVRNAVATATGG